MKDLLGKLNRIVDDVLEKLKNTDIELKIVNSLSQDDIVQLKVHVLNDLTKRDRLTNATFDEFIKEILKHLHIFYKKFINLDSYVKLLGTLANVNLMSLFDCCREIKLKGKTVKKELTEE